MDTNRMIELLKQALAETEELRTRGIKKEEFDLWRDKVLDTLEAGLGRKSTEFGRFASAVTTHISFYTEEQRKDEYNRRLVLYETALKSIIQKYEILGIETKQSIEVLPEEIFREVPPKAFIAHGGRSGILDKLRDFIQALGLDPLVVELLPSKGMSVDDKVNKYIKDADCGIVLATKGGIVDTKGKEPKQHPRLNVIDELERLRAVFPDKTILLLEKGVDLPSNISGLTYEPFVGQSMDRAFIAIARELVAFGILKAVKPPIKEQT